MSHVIYFHFFYFLALPNFSIENFGGILGGYFVIFAEHEFVQVTAIVVKDNQNASSSNIGAILFQGVYGV